MAPWDTHLRENNTVGGTFAYIIGGFKFLEVGGKSFFHVTILGLKKYHLLQFNWTRLCMFKLNSMINNV